MPGFNPVVADAMPVWSLPAERLLADLNSDPETGLNHAEASERLAREGPN